MIQAWASIAKTSRLRAQTAASVPADSCGYTNRAKQTRRSPVIFMSHNQRPCKIAIALIVRTVEAQNVNAAFGIRN